MIKLTRKNKIIFISLGIALCLGVIIIVIVNSLSGKTDNIGTINITVDGSAVNEYEIYCGGKSVQFGYSTSKGAATQAVFSIVGEEDYNCTLTSEGLFTTANKGGVVTVLVSITLGDATKTTSIDVTVKPRGLIEISTIITPHTKYIEGQKFNPTGLIIEATFENGDTEVITCYVIDNKDKQLTPEDTNITINYSEGDVTKTTFIPITVAPKTLESVIATASKTTFIEGDVLNNADFTVTAQYEYLEASVDNFTLSKTTQLTIDDTQVVVFYTENSVTKETVVLITVTPKTLQSIEVLAPPERTSYIEGEVFDIEGLLITKNYEYLQDIATGWTVDKTEQLMPGDTTIMVSCTENGVTKTVDIAITVAPRTLQSIEVTTLPETLSYIEGQAFDISGLILTAHYEFKDLIVSDYSVGATTKLLPVNTSVTISFTENGVTKQTTIEITVATKILQNIEITSLPTKTSYIEGQEFVPDGLTVKAVYEYVETSISTYSISVADTLLLGNEEAVVSFTDGAVTKTIKIELTIARRILQSLSITTSPAKLSYIEGESFDNTGLVLTANYEYLSEILTVYSTDKILPLMPSDAQITFSFTYHGVTKSTSQSITVAQRTLQSISVSHIPNTNAYIEGQTFNKIGLEITAHFEFKSLVVTDWTVDETTPLNYGATFVAVSYVENGITKTVNVHIVITDNLLESIHIQQLPYKRNYSIGENISLDGLIIFGYYTNGTTKELTTGIITDRTSPLEIGHNLVTIFYTESKNNATVRRSTSFTITITNRYLDNLIITQAPSKTDYIEGEFINLSGLIITAQFDNDTFLQVDDYIVGVLNKKLTLSDTAITVSYTKDGITKTTSFAIIIATKTLQAITIDTPPNKTSYIEGQTFNKTGLKITAVYEFLTETITDFTVDETTILRPANTSIQVSYTDSGITKYVVVPISVAAKSLQSISVNSQAVQKNYIEGQKFNDNGIIVFAHYEYINEEVTLYNVDEQTILLPSNSNWPISYTENGATKTALIPISVARRTLQSIEITALPYTTIYVAGQNFSSEGIIVTAHYEYMSLPVTGFTIDLEGAALQTTDTFATITYTEGLISKTETINLFITDNILEAIGIQQFPIKRDYTVGQTLDLEGLIVVGYYTNGLIEILSGFTVDRTEPLELNQGFITIFYTETKNNATVRRSTSFTITITNRYLDNLTITQAPSKTEYIEGEYINLSGLIVTAEFDNDTLLQVDNYSVGVLNKKLTLSDTSITVSYTKDGITKTTNFVITIIPKTLQAIIVDTPPDKTSYIEGQTFNKAGLKVTAVYEFLTENITDFTVDETAILRPSNTSMQVSYTDSGITKYVAVPISVAAKILQSISVNSQAVQKNYIEGQKFNDNGIVVTAHYEYINEEITLYVVDKQTVLLPSNSNWSISYTENGITKTALIPISVARRILQSIEVTALPYTIAYIEGQVFDSAGIEITAHYEYLDLYVTGFTVDLEGAELKINNNIATVTYIENGTKKTTSFNLMITYNLLERIDIVSPANKLSYSSGEVLSTVGLVLRAYYTNGKNKIVAGYVSDKQNPLTNTDTLVTISYTEANPVSQVTKFVTYTITVTERVLISIEIVSQPLKLSYIESELFSLTGLIIKAHYSDGSSQVVTNYTLSKTTGLFVDDTQIIVFYTENTTTKQAIININVAERVLTGLEIVAQPTKTEYKTGEKFVVSGLVVRAIYNNGAYYKTVTNYTLDKNNIRLSVNDEFIIISYTENGIIKTINLPIIVTARTLTNIVITAPASKLNYIEGEYLDILGLIITAQYNDAPNATVTNWTIDKTGALTLLDTVVTITYTESGVTKTISYNISIAPSQVVDAQVAATITAIDSLPNVERLVLADKAALLYAGELFTALTASQKDQITNMAKLLALLDKMIELEAAITPEPESEYNISYQIYGGLDFNDIDFTGADYPTIYRNSMGDIALNSVISELAAAQGYEFIKWIDESGDTVTSITDLSSDTIYYAFFQLTSTVNIVFYDYLDRNTLLALNDTARGEFDLLTNNIDADIFVNNSKLCMAYYVLDINGNLIQVTNNKIYTNYNSVIFIYIVTADYRQVNINPKNDFSLSYVYEYADKNNETKSVNKSFISGTQFLLPVSASVTITVINPMITNILLDGIGVGFTYPQTQYTFSLAEGIHALEITFTYYVAGNILITFAGLNTRIYSYSSQDWNGKLSSADLNDILFVFDENNNYYLNRYIINGVIYLYSDLTNLIFTANATVAVNRVANEFDLIFVYTGGNYMIEYLVGRQTVGNALSGISSKTAFIDDIFTNLIIYIDASRETVITRAELFDLYLADNITLYIAIRSAWILTINNNGEEIQLEILSDEDFDLVNELPILNKQGFTFKGYSLTESGSILTSAQFLIIIANLNTPTTIFVVYEAIEGYEPPEIVDYLNESFIGEWTTTHNNGAGIVTSSVTLNGDGTYEYETLLNGIISVKLAGEYRLKNGKIEIQSLVMDGDYQLINKSELILNIEWIGDNILIATCFTRNSMTINSYLHYMTRGQVRSANYNGTDILGEYVMRLDSLASGTLTEQVTIFNFYANGTITAMTRILINSEEVSSLIENALFRITFDNKIWIISNGSLGTMDITDTLRNMFVKSGQDYSAIIPGSFIAANEESSAFVSLIIISANGEISFTDSNSTIRTTKLNIQTANEYACILQTDMLYKINIEVVYSGNLLIVILNDNQVLYYNKID